MSADWKRIRQVLAEAAALNSAVERAAYLDEACRGEEGLRAEVEELLQAYDQAGTFLETPALALPEAVTGSPSALAEQVGDRIGPYKLLEPIGEGGCGVVYLAEQEQPIRREVALKVIKLGMDTKAVIARFEAERQALALMDHPHIARVLDAGATDTGRPYFVMELVRGIKITQYCDEHQLSTPARLNLFVQVCHAIQHAHQKGIIHRDIKPSNILVSLQDGAPVPKVIDFGIAKATARRLTEETVLTAIEQFIGTPAYMSPEQARVSPDALGDIDTRSDIYSLGVLLYELLTGRTPFDQKELVAAGLDEMRRIIREEEPKRPSTRLSTLAAADQTTLAKCRHAEPPQLIHLLRGDLDWIVMRCLEKDRTRRYESANSLAEDIERHVSNEPVRARPPSRLYQFQKLVQRNKGTFAAAGMVSVALVLGLGFSLRLLAKERAARRQALLAEQKAQQVAQFLKEMLQGVGPSVALGRDTTLLREILDKTAERVGTDLKGQPEVEAELRTTLGEVYAALAQGEKAEEMYRAALVLGRGVWGNLHTNVADALDRLGWLLLDLKVNVEASEPLLEQALLMRTQLLGAEHAQVAASLSHLGRLRLWQGRTAEGEALYERSLALRRRLLGNEHLAVAQCLAGLATAWLDLGRPEAAEAALREALAIEARVLPDERAAPGAGASKLLLGTALRRQGKLEEAESLVRQAATLRQNLLGEHPNVAGAWNGLARVLAMQGKLEEAEGLARSALALGRKTLAERHPFIATTLDELGWILRRAGKREEAEAAYGEALALWKSRGAINVEYELGELCDLLCAERRFADAVRLCRENLEDLGASPAPERRCDALFVLGRVLHRQSQPAEAEPLLRQAIASLGALSAPSRRAQVLLLLAQVVLEQSRPAETDLLLQEVLESQKAFPASSFRFQALAVLGEKHLKEGNWRAAEAELRQAVRLSRELGLDPESRQWVAAGAGRALKNQEQWAEAELFYRESLTHCAKLRPNELQSWQWQVTDLDAVFRVQGKLADVETLYREMVDLARKAGDPEVLIASLIHLSGALRDQQKVVESEPPLREALSAAQALAATTPGAESLRLLIEVLLQQGQLAPAESLVAEALEQAKRSPVSAALADGLALQALKLAALQAWLGREAERTVLCRQMLEWLADRPEPALAEHVAKAICLRPPVEPQLAAAALGLARRAAELAQKDSWLAWYQLCLGLAEYRNGNDLAADRVLSAAELESSNTWHQDVRVRTARFYHALSLFRQGQLPAAQHLFMLAETGMKPPPAAGQWPLTGEPDLNDINELILWLACREAGELLQGPAGFLRDF